MSFADRWYGRTLLAGSVIASRSSGLPAGFGLYMQYGGWTIVSEQQGLYYGLSVAPTPTGLLDVACCLNVNVSVALIGSLHICMDLLASHWCSISFSSSSWIISGCSLRVWHFQFQRTLSHKIVISILMLKSLEDIGSNCSITWPAFIMKT